jgi:hypothetical protein
MARHNREGRGIDQHGELWKISYQPDWLRQVKISRELPDGRRRSSLTLFRNPARVAEGSPGKIVRTRITAADGSLDFQVSLENRQTEVDELVVSLWKHRGRTRERVKFILQGGMVQPRKPRRVKRS